MLSCAKMTNHDADLVIWGITTSGSTFRPRDWADRLAGLTSAFGPDQKLVYSPLVLPVSLNALRFEYVHDALAMPDALGHPLAAARGEPHEPVQVFRRAACGESGAHPRVAVHNGFPRKRSGRPAGRPDRSSNCRLR